MVLLVALLWVDSAGCGASLHMCFGLTWLVGWAGWMVRCLLLRFRGDSASGLFCLVALLLDFCCLCLRFS